MAILTTEDKTLLTVKKAGVISFPGITVESARAVSELLQRDKTENNGFMHSRGFINHVNHALLASYDFGATPAHLNSVYERGKKDQRPRPGVDQKTLTDLSDESTWDKYLGDNSHYSDFLGFFEAEMDKIGFQEMINKRLFAGTDAADGLLVRAFAPLYHPMIEIGYGIEFGLPGLIPVALAQAAGSTSWPEVLFLKSEAEARAAKESGPGKSLRALLDEIHNDEKVRGTAYEAETFLNSKLTASSLAGIISYVKQVRVPVDQINEKMVESINISALIMGSAVRRDKQIKLDFFLLHCFTTSIFLTQFVAQDWITPENKARFLEWKIRFDLFWYASAGSPPLLVDEIENYIPKIPLGGNPWLDIIERGLRCQDDGHTLKAIRALVSGERVMESAVRRDKQIKLDFFLLHCFTTSIFLTQFVAQDWITPENKARFLEWKIRFDLFWYASAGSPPLLVDEIENYIPKIPLGGNPWLDIIERGLRCQDDGHTLKAIRALVSGERVMERYRDISEQIDRPIVGDMWLKIAAMCIDAAENAENALGIWIRGAGYDELWESVGPRETRPGPNV